jgi:phosphoribosylaminoimidazolecarboxamide formyltransferase/IMP cyclohydrolase
MHNPVKIRKALISVYDKTGLEPLLHSLHKCGVEFISTGGTQAFIESLGYVSTPVESLTDFPSIFGGRVKTLHPRIFGGILYRRELENDLIEADSYQISPIDLVLVDLYPFEQTVRSGASHEDIIEKIDIGGISLIRAAAKNYRDVLICASVNYYQELQQILDYQNGETSVEQRMYFATRAFQVSSHYDTQIFGYFNTHQQLPVFKQSIDVSSPLRYGENPHQKGTFFGNLDDIFDKLNGKEISYNNLLDIDAAVGLAAEFNDTVFAILKHNNACGIAIAPTVSEAYSAALAGDPVSAFGGVLITNRTIDEEAAKLMNNLFFEIVIAPGYTPEALHILKSKTNRIILLQKKGVERTDQFRSILNGILAQDKDTACAGQDQMKVVTAIGPNAVQTADLVFANKVVKHTKSNAIVLVKNKQLMGIGTGHTSRIDALKHAIAKAAEAGLDIQGAVMASDAFFPFPDCVEISHAAGIVAIVQPGGSVKDKDSIDKANELGMSMVFTGIRHFRH